MEASPPDPEYPQPESQGDKDRDPKEEHTHAEGHVGPHLEPEMEVLEPSLQADLELNTCPKDVVVQTEMKEELNSYETRPEMDGEESFQESRPCSKPLNHQEQGPEISYEEPGWNRRLEESWNGIRVISSCLAVKRRLRGKLSDQKRVATGLEKYWFILRFKAADYLHVRLSSWLYLLQPWRHHLQTIGGRFGSTVEAYFSFLRFIVVLNIFLVVMVLIFVTVPAAILHASGSKSHDPSTNCTAYIVKMETLDLFPDHLLDILSGTGILELTFLFYGTYAPLTGSLWNGMEYSLVMAYLFVPPACLFFSLVWMLKRLALGLKRSIVGLEQRPCPFSRLLFTGWDFCLREDKAALLHKHGLGSQIRSLVAGRRRGDAAAMRTDMENFKLFALRVTLNVLVLALLGAALAAIAVATISAPKLNNLAPKSGFRFLLIQYLPSIIISTANFIMPHLFSLIATFEDYGPNTGIWILLMRLIVLRLASLSVLLISLWAQISLCNDKSCGSCGYNHESFPCWETIVGQELYKLTIFDFLTTFALIVCVEFPRKLIVTYCPWKLVHRWGEQQLNVATNVLDVVYGQTICWAAIFFTPLMPVIVCIKYILIFYLKKVSLMENFRPFAHSNHIIGSDFFFSLVLLLGLGVAAVPVVTTMGWMIPSKACGPFRGLTSTLALVDALLTRSPSWLQKSMSFAFSQIIAVPLFLLSCLLLSGLLAKLNAQRHVVKLLKEELAAATKEKQFLARLLQDS
uniref:transmembrane channel-like protein 7 n=1 Tax=Myxine glutinosa TaxID=7769 RepID=UPI00358F9146